MSDVNQETIAPRTPLHQFTVPLSAPRRGARLARLLATEQLSAWGLPLDPARLIVAELATNAVVHGRVPSRGFRLTLTVTVGGMLRIEVADPRGESTPVARDASPEPAESGYGLLLAGESADEWGVLPGPFPCKTVWVELELGRLR